ncbi:MAG TPA: hypothetical protein VJ753_02330 [Rhizomicrobium sp.]|nr:hypothetical protein [Rhizomicrobium sp.]HKY18890.1 hypothetical protein [Rhizomicrobium sp.]
MPQFGAKCYLALLFVVASSIGGAAYWFLSIEDLGKVLLFYQGSMRQPLFAGLLTVSAFLFSLKTFIIVTMKTNVYGTDEYKAKWEEKKKLNSELKRYAPLRNFALLLFFAVLVSLIAAISQFTIGLLDTPLAAIIPLSLAVWSISMIFVSLVYLQVNLRSWFKFLDESSG